MSDIMKQAVTDIRLLKLKIDRLETALKFYAVGKEVSYIAIPDEEGEGLNTIMAKAHINDIYECLEQLKRLCDDKHRMITERIEALEKKQ